jgi:transposase
MVLDHLRQHPQYRPKAMLRVLSYAYATGVFCSEEIARKCQFEAVFKLLCEGQPSFPDELSLFRRRNRKVLERILSQALLQASEDQDSPDRQRERTGIRHNCLAGQAAERLNIARHLDSGE